MYVQSIELLFLTIGKSLFCKLGSHIPKRYIYIFHYNQLAYIKSQEIEIIDLQIDYYCISIVFCIPNVWTFIAPTHTRMYSTFTQCLSLLYSSMRFCLIRSHLFGKIFSIIFSGISFTCLLLCTAPNRAKN